MVCGFADTGADTLLCHCKQGSGDEAAIRYSEIGVQGITITEVKGFGSPAATGSAIYISIDLAADSGCQIDYSLEVRELAGPVLHASSGNLNAASLWSQVTLPTAGEPYARIKVEGRAVECTLDEYLSFVAISAVWETDTGKPLGRTFIRPSFRVVGDESLPVYPLNPLPYGYFVSEEARSGSE